MNSGSDGFVTIDRQAEIKYDCNYCLHKGLCIHERGYQHAYKSFDLMMCKTLDKYTNLKINARCRYFMSEKAANR